MQTSKPSLQLFQPTGYQSKVVDLIRNKFDYSRGNLEILLSGSYGSMKSALLAHLAVTHALMYPRAGIAIVRKSLPDLKQTLFKEIIDHIETDAREGLTNYLVEGKDYWVNTTRGSIRFKNGSEISPIFWSDRRYKRARSRSFSMVLIEEGTENDLEDKNGYEEIKARLRRIPHISENVLVIATNPDSPSHWIYDEFIAVNQNKQHPTRYVFYSRTEDNPYLDPIYISGLRANMDERRAQRFLDGLWIEISKDMVYYSYSEDNYVPKPYRFNPNYPIHLSWDFNIGVGKPLSACVFQYINDTFHFGKEIVIEGMRTQDSLEEMAARGILDMPCLYFVVNGDASGKHKDTRNRRDDYEIIVDYLSNYKTAEGKPISFRKIVPLANPPVRQRHNMVNAYAKNANNDVRLFVYEECPNLHKGFRLVELLKGASYQENDGPAFPFQHVTTAAGYGIYAATVLMSPRNQRTIQL